MASHSQKKESFQELIEKKRLLICCGSGGVGKTTTAAAFGLRAAQQGKKTLVLTIDPAKRLANSLGIEKIDYQEKQISEKEIKNAGMTASAPLFAMMLDTKRTFDQLILKYAPSQEKADVILQNQLYQHLSSMVAGSQEYMAMEKVYEISQERDYDLIVLDTPPSRHALDFLDAPQRMRHMIGDSVMNWFLKPSLFVSKIGFRLLDKSMRRVLSSFDKVAGLEFLQDLSAMLISTSALLEGFQERAEKVEKILHARDTTFILIAAPQPIPLGEAKYFYEKIQEYGLPFAGFIFNRVQTLPRGEKLAADLSEEAKQGYFRVKDLFQKLSERDQREIQQFKSSLKVSEKNCLFKSIPQLDRDIHDLKGLSLLGEKIFA